MTEINLLTATFEELEAAGLDDCGLPLEGHPPLPKPKPWGSSWTHRPSRMGSLSTLEPHARKPAPPRERGVGEQPSAWRRGAFRGPASVR